MKKITLKWLRLGALLAVVLLPAALTVANACSSATAPAYPQPPDTTKAPDSTPKVS